MFPNYVEEYLTKSKNEASHPFEHVINNKTKNMQLKFTIIFNIYHVSVKHELHFTCLLLKTFNMFMMLTIKLNRSPHNNCDIKYNIRIKCCHSLLSFNSHLTTVKALSLVSLFQMRK